MENPYESPTAQPQSRESMRSLRRRKLVCPHCHESHVTAGWAYVCYPQMKVRCSGCRGRSKVRLSSDVWWRYWIIATIPIIISLAVIPCIERLLELVDRIMENWLHDSWMPLGFSSQKFALAAILLIICLTPILSTLAIAVRFCLRLIADHSTLEPVRERRTKNV